MKLDRKISYDTAEVATPAEPEKAKKWRNKFIHLPTGEVDFGGKLHDTKEEAYAGYHRWLKRTYDLLKQGRNPVDPNFNGKEVNCTDIQYLGPVEVDV